MEFATRNLLASHTCSLSDMPRWKTFVVDQQLGKWPSASANSIDWTATIHWPSRSYDTCNRPGHQPDPGSYDAADRIANVSAVNHRAGRFTACDHATGDH